MLILVKLPNGDFINLAHYSSFRFADGDEVCQACLPTGKSDFIRGENVKALRDVLEKSVLIDASENPDNALPDGTQMIVINARDLLENVGFYTDGQRNDCE